MRILTLASAALLLATPALAAPAAIVEDAEGGVVGVEALDYVDAGRVIELKLGGVLVLGYLKSCVHETIRGGGTVKIGAEQSEVTGGRVERKTNPCDGGKLQLTTAQAGKSGAMVFRKAPTAQAGAAKSAAADLTIYGISPVVALGAGAAAKNRITFERIDQSGAPIAVDVTGAKTDLAKSGVRLAPGGLYRASAGERSLVVQIDAAAASGGPVTGRLIQF